MQQQQTNVPTYFVYNNAKKSHTPRVYKLYSKLFFFDWSLHIRATPTIALRCKLPYLTKRTTATVTTTIEKKKKTIKKHNKLPMYVYTSTKKKEAGIEYIHTYTYRHRTCTVECLM